MEQTERSIGGRTTHSRRTVLRAALTAPALTAAGHLASLDSVVASQATPSAENVIPGGAPGVPDVYLKAPPVFDSAPDGPATSDTLSTFQIAWSPPPPPREDNRYWQELEKRLGTRFEPTLAPSTNYQEKLATTAAGGDLPDLTYLTGLQPLELVAQGAFTDLTPFLSGEGLNEYPNLVNVPKVSWKTSTIDGKIYGVPAPATQASGMLFFRQDWAEKVGFGEIKSADDFFKCMVAFTEQDPNGNGQADSWGLSGTVFSASFFPQMFGAPNGWRLNDDGSLTSIYETEEYRQAIDFMRRLADAGAYHPDTAGLNSEQIKDLFVTSQIGAYTDGIYGLLNPVRGRRLLILETVPDANPTALIPPGPEAVYHNGTGAFGFTAIPSKVGQDEERVRELLRVLNWFAGPFGSEEEVFLHYGVEGVHHEVNAEGVRIINDRFRQEQGSMYNLFHGTTTPTNVLYYPEAPENATLGQELMRDALAIGIDDPTLGLYSATRIEKGAELDQLINDRITNVVSGRDALDALDEMVNDWRSRGGDQIRTEFQEALQAS